MVFVLSIFFFLMKLRYRDLSTSYTQLIVINFFLCQDFVSLYVYRYYIYFFFISPLILCSFYWAWSVSLHVKAGGEGDDRGWVGWMASPIQWTWVWVNSKSWWWTGRPGLLQPMGLKRVGHDWVTELNWTDVIVKYVEMIFEYAYLICISYILHFASYFFHKAIL